MFGHSGSTLLTLNLLAIVRQRRQEERQSIPCPSSNKSQKYWNVVLTISPSSTPLSSSPPLKPSSSTRLLAPDLTASSFLRHDWLRPVPVQLSDNCGIAGSTHRQQTLFVCRAAGRCFGAGLVLFVAAVAALEKPPTI